MMDDWGSEAGKGLSSMAMEKAHRHVHFVLLNDKDRCVIEREMQKI